MTGRKFQEGDRVQLVQRGRLAYNNDRFVGRTGTVELVARDITTEMSIKYVVRLDEPYYYAVHLLLYANELESLEPMPLLVPPESITSHNNPPEYEHPRVVMLSREAEKSIKQHLDIAGRPGPVYDAANYHLHAAMMVLLHEMTPDPRRAFYGTLSEEAKKELTKLRDEVVFEKEQSSRDRIRYAVQTLAYQYYVGKENTAAWVAQRLSKMLDEWGL